MEPCASAATLLQCLARDPVIPQGDPALALAVDVTHLAIGDNSKLPASSILGQQAEAGPGYPQVITRHASAYSYDTFVQECMAPNVPVLIQAAAEGWRAMREWVTADGHVDLDALERLAGQSRVSVTDVTSQLDDRACPTEMTFSEYAAWWRSSERTQLPQAGPVLYLKDWHFASEQPQYEAYQVPIYFQDDWLNWFYHNRQNLGSHAACLRSGAQKANHPTLNHAATCQASSSGLPQPAQVIQPAPSVDLKTESAAEGAVYEQATGGVAEDAVEQSSVLTSDYRFVYLGPRGTWTPLHADVLRSYSWSTNVAGRKRWLLLPPEHTHLLYSRHGRALPGTFFQDDVAFPGLQQARRHLLECIQEAGDTLFVPSGWHHTVENLEDTLSINHNWLNGYNIHWAWAFLHQQYLDVAASIEDCRSICTTEEFEALVQRNLGLNAGLDFMQLGAFLTSIIRREFAALYSTESGKFDHVSRFEMPGQLHCCLNLKRAAGALRQLMVVVEQPVQASTDMTPRGIRDHAEHVLRAADEWLASG